MLLVTLQIQFNLKSIGTLTQPSSALSPRLAGTKDQRLTAFTAACGDRGETHSSRSYFHNKNNYFRR